jgi:hypothetical protein
MNQKLKIKKKKNCNEKQKNQPVGHVHFMCGG